MIRMPFAQRLAVLLALAAGLCFGAPAAARDGTYEPQQIVTSKGPAKIQVEVVDNNRDREHGLMYRMSRAPDRGMLFDFKREKDVAFWMKNTYIGLDMVFIRADGTILSITRDAKPFDETPLPSGGPVRAVLEIPAGRAAESGVLPGDRVLHRSFPAR